MHRTILIGLSPETSSVVTNIIETLSDKNDSLKRILSGIIIDDGNKLKSFFRSESKLAVNGTEIKKKERDIKNYSEFTEDLNNISDFIINHYNILNSAEISGGFQSQDLEIDKDILVYFFVDSKDKNALQLLIPFLGAFQKETAYGGRLVGNQTTISQPQIILYMPDLFDYEKPSDEDEAFNQTYTIFEKLDYLNSNGSKFYYEINDLKEADKVYPSLPYSRIFVFSGGGSQKIKFERLFEPTLKFISGNILNEYELDNLFSAKYFSFGYAELVYPEKDILKLLSDYLTHETLKLKTEIGLSEKDIEKIENSLTGGFVVDNKINYESLKNEFSNDNDGLIIWKPDGFKPQEGLGFLFNSFKNEKERFEKIKINSLVNEIIPSFVDRIKEEGTQYKEGKVSEALGKLADRYDQYSDNLRQIVNEKIGEFTDNFGIDYSVEFLKKLIAKKKNIITGKDEENFLKKIKSEAEDEIKKLKKESKKYNQEKLAEKLNNSEAGIVEAKNKCINEFERYDIFKRKWYVVNPLLSLSIYVLSFFILSSGLKIITVSKALNFGVKLFPFVLIVFLFKLFRNRSIAKKELVNTINTYEENAKQKITNMNRFTNYYEEFGKLEYEIERNEKILKFCDQFEEDIKSDIEKLKKFKECIEELRDEKKKEFENMDLSGNSLLRNVVKKENIEKWFNEYDTDKKIIRDGFFIENKLSRFFEEFSQEEGKFNDRYFDAIKVYAKEQFKIKLEQSIEIFFEELEQKDFHNHLDSLLKFSAPQIGLTNLKEGKGVDVEYAKYLSVLDGEESKTYEYFNEKKEMLFINKSTPDKNRITLFQFSFGFTSKTIPAYIRGKMLFDNKNRKK